MILSLISILLVDFTLELETKFKLPELTRPYYFDAAPDKLYVLDAATCHVHYWDMDGNYLGKFAQKGEGPGEFLTPGQIIYFKKQIIVMDSGSGKVHFFNSEHEYMHSKPMAGRLVLWKTDNALVVHQASTSRGREQAYLSDETFSQVQMLGEMKYKKHEFVDKVNYIFRPFANEYRPATSPNRIYLGESQDHTVKVFDGSGNHLKDFHVPVSRRDVLQDEKDLYKNAYARHPATLEFGEAPYIDRILAFDEMVVVVQKNKAWVFDLNFKKLGDLDADLSNTDELISYRAMGQRLISVSYGGEEDFLIRSYKIKPKKP